MDHILHSQTKMAQPLFPKQKPVLEKPGNFSLLSLSAVLRIRIQIQRIYIFLCLPDPDPLVKGMDPGPDLAPFYHPVKIVRKTLIPTVL
jgi:hypothetical protein